MASENNETGRAYIVLQHLPAEGVFREVTTLTANGPAQAGRRAAKQIDDAILEQGVELVAIPERNWATIKLQLQRQSKLVENA